MSSSPKSFLLGLALLVGVVALIIVVTGLRGLAYIAVLGAVGSLSAHLWQKDSRACKVIAAWLMPSLFWAWLMSKKTRLAIQQFADRQ
jgi:hypothetical protein